MFDPRDQAVLDAACALLDSVGAQQEPAAVAVWALAAADHLTRAGAEAASVPVLAAAPRKAVRRALRLLSTLSDDALADSSVLDALHATQRALAASA